MQRSGKEAWKCKGGPEKHGRLHGLQEAGGRNSHVSEEVANQVAPAERPTAMNARAEACWLGQHESNPHRTRVKRMDHLFKAETSV